jgi:predicted kinase
VSAGGPVPVEEPAVVLMCGLPASGKTTTAERLHAAIGGTLVRSCDVYRVLGIDLPAWVRRTRGFTVDVDLYDRARDEAYREMGRRLDAALLAGAAPVIVDAVHGEPEKRAAVYTICLARGATPVLLRCRCDDPVEVSQRFRARSGRERDPRHEASDLSVYRDIARRWQDPAGDRLPDGRAPALITYDTAALALREVRPDAAAPGVARLVAALATDRAPV